MREYAVLITVIASLHVGTVAWAGENVGPRFVFSEMVGLASPLGDTRVASGFSIGVSADLWMTPHMAMGLEAAVNPMHAEAGVFIDPFLGLARLDDGSARPFQVGAHVRWRPIGPKSWAPWLQGGVAGYYVQERYEMHLVGTPGVPESHGDEIQSGIGFSAGGGFLLWDNGGGTQLGAYAMFHRFNIDPPSPIVPLEKYLNLGLTVAWYSVENE